MNNKDMLIGMANVLVDTVKQGLILPPSQLLAMAEILNRIAKEMDDD